MRISIVSRTNMARSKFAEMLPTPEIGKTPHQPSNFLFPIESLVREMLVKQGVGGLNSTGSNDSLQFNKLNIINIEYS